MTSKYGFHLYVARYAHPSSANLGSESAKMYEVDPARLGSIKSFSQIELLVLIYLHYHPLSLLHNRELNQSEGCHRSAHREDLD